MRYGELAVTQGLIRLCVISTMRKGKPSSLRIAFRFPWQRFRMMSPMPLKDARAALEARVRKGNLIVAMDMFPNADEVPFRGSVDGFSFCIVRRIGYRNSFIPLITGTLTERPEGTLVEGHMRMWAPVTIFVVLWMGAVTTVALTGIVELLTQGHPSKLLAIGMWIFGAALFTGGFGSEAVRADELLRDIFKTAETRG